LTWVTIIKSFFYSAHHPLDNIAAPLAVAPSRNVIAIEPSSEIFAIFGLYLWARSPFPRSAMSFT
jgi:hypothetical protein